MKKFVNTFIIWSFLVLNIGPLPAAYAQTIMDLPAPGVMVNTSNLYHPLELKGILINPHNPLEFNFLIDKGNSHLMGQSLKDEITRSSKYFLTCLAVPEMICGLIFHLTKKTGLYPVILGLP